MRRLLASCTVLLLLGGCLGRVEVSQLGAMRDQMVAPATAAGPKPTLWYVGVGLWDETWSENDVAALADALGSGASGFRVTPVVLSNHPGRFPPATRANAEAAFRTIAADAKPGDVALLYVSTHGAPGVLARAVPGGGPRPVRADELRSWLAPIGSMPTVAVLSACYAGSLIPALAGDDRIVITAARADRSSFGCQAGAKHTVFGQAVLGAFARPGQSLRAAFAEIQAEVTRAERHDGIRTPSEPQLAVGAREAALFDAPVF